MGFLHLPLSAPALALLAGMREQADAGERFLFTRHKQTSTDRFEIGKF
jgi:hypothetical protein